MSALPIRPEWLHKPDPSSPASSPVPAAPPPDPAPPLSFSDPALEVRWTRHLLDAPADQQVAYWARSLHGFAKRLPPEQRARFLLGLDAPFYTAQGEAAVDAEQGVHPKHRLTKYHEFFVTRTPAHARVLDLGCGIGALAASVAARAGSGAGCTVTGLDLSARNLDKARRIAESRHLQPRLTYLPGDITTTRAPGAFDVIILSNVLEHLKDRSALLRQWTQWYTPRSFLIRVPAFERDWRVAYKQELGVEWRLDDTHETEYTEDQLRRELADAGLVVNELIIRWGEFWTDAAPAVSA